MEDSSFDDDFPVISSMLEETAQTDSYARDSSDEGSAGSDAAYESDGSAQQDGTEHEEIDPATIRTFEALYESLELSQDGEQYDAALQEHADREVEALLPVLLVPEADRGAIDLEQPFEPGKGFDTETTGARIADFITSVGTCDEQDAAHKQAQESEWQDEEKRGDQEVRQLEAELGIPVELLTKPVNNFYSVPLAWGLVWPPKSIHPDEGFHDKRNRTFQLLDAFGFHLLLNRELSDALDLHPHGGHDPDPRDPTCPKSIFGEWSWGCDERIGEVLDAQAVRRYKHRRQTVRGVTLLFGAQNRHVMTPSLSEDSTEFVRELDGGFKEKVKISYWVTYNADKPDEIQHLTILLAHPTYPIYAPGFDATRMASYALDVILAEISTAFGVSVPAQNRGIFSRLASMDLGRKPGQMRSIVIYRWAKRELELFAEENTPADWPGITMDDLRAASLPHIADLVVEYAHTYDTTAPFNIRPTLAHPTLLQKARAVCAHSNALASGASRARARLPVPPLDAAGNSQAASVTSAGMPLSTQHDAAGMRAAHATYIKDGPVAPELVLAGSRLVRPPIVGVTSAGIPLGYSEGVSRAFWQWAAMKMGRRVPFIKDETNALVTSSGAPLVVVVHSADQLEGRYPINDAYDASVVSFVTSSGSPLCATTPATSRRPLNFLLPLQFEHGSPSIMITSAGSALATKKSGHAIWLSKGAAIQPVAGEGANYIHVASSGSPLAQTSNQAASTTRADNMRNARHPVEPWKGSIVARVTSAGMAIADDGQKRAGRYTLETKQRNAGIWVYE
ncbi:hypothetical protein Rhopal_004082-T1 [Rhodotorula paludigena]|uniref:Uncharacterized protein n=1 Tax=Rhodotorula paludigena TaxID=86838 RepID=A0AAV5GNI9_9BASI|nr:hypothetical protein Rhopal_004082-T1 [Rhodotorula paludigena]